MENMMENFEDLKKSVFKVDTVSFLAKSEASPLFSIIL